MSQAPCTLFCPRSGFTRAERLPILPSSICRLATERTLSVPVTCSVRPRVSKAWQNRLRQGMGQLYNFTGSNTALSAAHSGEYSLTFSHRASKFSQCWSQIHGRTDLPVAHHQAFAELHGTTSLNMLVSMVDQLMFTGISTTSFAPLLTAFFGKVAATGCA